MSVESSRPRHYDTAFVFPMDQPVDRLEAKDSFEKLTDREKLYAHHISRASFYGGLIVLLQTSPESTQIYRLIQRINKEESTAELFESVKGLGVSEEDFKAFLIYCSGIYTNMGNYKGFGDSKFVPDVTPEIVEVIVKNSKAWKNDSSAMEAIWNSCKDHIWSLDGKKQCLGMGEGGITTYFSQNCTKEDMEKINRFFKERNMEGYINRAIKTSDLSDGKDLFEIRNAGVKEAVLQEKVEFEGANFIVTSGDYGPLLQLVCDSLASAKSYAANEDEVKMLECYIESFQNGSLDAHKNGSRHWIKNKSPIIETYIGFIETYRDPMGMRGEFEGFVAMVNKEQSAKYQILVDSAPDFLKLLPWPADFEKDVFLKPDFTSLDILSFAGSGIPAGINIPNYDEIRQSEGFKNVSLGNVLASTFKSSNKPSLFVSQEDHQLLDKFSGKAFNVQVALHELLGHGSGKLLQVIADIGQPNFNLGQVINPLTKEPIDLKQVYQAGETYDSVFTSLGSTFEECRAEAVGLYLCTFPEVHQIFELGDTASDVTYINWLLLCQSGMKGLEMYNPGSQEWKQAHSQARFAILNVLLEAGQGFLTVKTVTGDDGQPDIRITMDRSKLEGVGKPAIGDFLLKLQVYKSTANFTAANEMFHKYTSVNGGSSIDWLQMRQVVMARKRPRKMLVQANTILKDEALSLVEYDASHEGMMQSWRDRFSSDEVAKIDAILNNLYLRDLPHFSDPKA